MPGTVLGAENKTMDNSKFLKERQVQHNGRVFQSQHCWDWASDEALL